MTCNNSFIIREFEKKLLIQNLYSKFIVRSSEKIEYRKNLIVIDNNSNLFVFQLKRRFLRRFSKYLNTGISFFFNTLIYTKRNRKNFQFKFEQISLKSRLIPINYVHFLFTKLQSLRSKKKFLILVRPCRGGIKCIFNGLKGIIPRKHLIFFFIKLFTKPFSINDKSPLAKLKFDFGRQPAFGFVFLNFLLKLKYSFYFKRFLRLKIRNLKKKRMGRKKRRFKIKKLRKTLRKAIRFFCLDPLLSQFI